jgi:hypothetical protein
MCEKTKGYLKGEICNRDGCEGIIQHHQDGCCSCHIHPPCSYCTDDGQYCDTCDWNYSDELYELEQTKRRQAHETELSIISVHKTI